MNIRMTLASAMILGSTLAASGVDVNDLTGAQNWIAYDVRPAGFAGVTTDQPRNGNGSLEISFTDNGNTSQSKAGALGGVPASTYGTLGSLLNGSLSFDWYRDASSTAVAHLAPAFKLHVRTAGGTDALLIWEHVYNAGGAAPTNTWVEEDLIGQNFWIRSNSTNYDIAGGWQPLSWFAAGNTISGSLALGADTQILGIEIGAGSGLSGDFLAYADDVSITVVGGAAYNYNFEVIPAPASAALLALGVPVAMRRRRR